MKKHKFIKLSQFCTIKPGIKVAVTRNKLVTLFDGSIVIKSHRLRKLLHPNGNLTNIINTPDYLAHIRAVFSRHYDKYVLKDDCQLVDTPDFLATHVFTGTLVRAVDGVFFFNEYYANDAGYYENYYGDFVRDEDFNGYNAGYHDLERTEVVTNETIYGCGLEIEKEDSRTKRSVDYDSLYNNTKWIKENDGSLNEYSGYELVSPTFDLMSDYIEQALENPEIEQLVNANYSSACGGHINLSDKCKSPEDMAYHFKYWMPLFYALYPERAIGSYSQAIPYNRIAYDSKSNAITKKSFGIELRIFPAVENKRDLLWRINLLRYIIKTKLNSTEELLAQIQQEPLKSMLTDKNINQINNYFNLCA